MANRMERWASAVRAAKAARASVMFDRLGALGFVLYFLIIGGVILALVQLTSRVADYAVASRAREASAGTGTSGVTVGLEAQQRAAGWQPTGYGVERPPEHHNSFSVIEVSPRRSWRDRRTENSIG